MEEPPSKRHPAASLTDDLLVEILRRLPIRSVCRFKCVSRSWRMVISDPVHRKKLPQTLTGFFYSSYSGERFPSKAHHFTNVTGKGVPFIFPSFYFLPFPSAKVNLLDSCNGLLLCRCFEPGPPREGEDIPPFHYIVCNPATEKWVMLPDGSWAANETRAARLGFDPTVSSHFHVIEYVVDEEECITGVEIYSSKTAEWSFKESEWGNDVMLCSRARSVFLNGFMHMLAYSDGIVAVDMDGKTWRTISIPDGCDDDVCIHLARGHLFLANVDSENAFKLSFWILENYGTHEWTFKHTVSPVKLFRKNLQYDLDYTVITVHPECNLIFFVFGWDKTLMAYEMDRKEVRVIRNLGHDCWDPYLPYVPCFLEALADEQ